MEEINYESLNNEYSSKPDNTFHEVISKLKTYEEEYNLLEKKFKRKVFDLFTLFDISKQLNSSLETERLIHLIVNTCKAQMKVRNVALFLLNEDNDYLLKSAKGFKEEPGQLIIPANSSLITEINKIKQPLLIENLETTEFTDTKEMLTTLSVKLCAPLFVEEDLKGILFLGERRRGTFSEDDTGFISTLANQAVVAIENAKLYESLKEKLNQLSTLYEISKIINQSNDVNEILKLFTDTLSTGFKVQKCLLFLKEDDKFTFQSSVDMNKEHYQNVTLSPPDDNTEHWLNSNQQQYITSDKSEYKDIANILDDENKDKLHEVLAIPLFAGGKTVGTLLIFAVEHISLKDEETQNLFMVISSQISPPLLMARVLEEQKESISDPFTPFQTKLEKELQKAQENNYSLSVLFIQILNIKDIMSIVDINKLFNFIDTILKDDFSASGEPYRYSRRSYAIILPLTNKEQAKKLLAKSRLQTKIQSNFAKLTESNFKLNYNTVTYPDDGNEVIELINKAFI